MQLVLFISLPLAVYGKESPGVLPELIAFAAIGVILSVFWISVYHIKNLFSQKKNKKDSKESSCQEDFRDDTNSCIQPETTQEAGVIGDAFQYYECRFCKRMIKSPKGLIGRMRKCGLCEKAEVVPGKSNVTPTADAVETASIRSEKKWWQ